MKRYAASPPGEELRRTILAEPRGRRRVGGGKKSGRGTPKLAWQEAINPAREIGARPNSMDHQHRIRPTRAGPADPWNSKAADGVRETEPTPDRWSKIRATLFHHSTAGAVLRGRVLGGLFAARVWVKTGCVMQGARPQSAGAVQRARARPVFGQPCHLLPPPKLPIDACA